MKIAILGGGQLARMLAISGYPLGIDFICIEPKINCAAKKVTEVLHCEFDRLDEISKYLHEVDCVTYETENLPLEAVKSIANQYNLFPNIDILRVTQDRLYEKEFFKSLNIPTADFYPIESWDDLKECINKLDFPLVLKTRRHGYDGKGQMIMHNMDDAKQAWESMRNYALIVETFISYQFEISLISVRNHSGDVSFYPLTLNHHKNGILRLSEAPYCNDKLQQIAEKYALNILEKFNYVGVMTIEFFCIDNTLIANEIAPRVHNSGHWTIEGADTSQFENHLRAILGLPLGSTKSRGLSAMINCIDYEPKKMGELLKIPGLHYHTYGKEPLPNRKLGHITLCNDNKKMLATHIKKTLNYISEG